ncbi:MAG TPA: choice-of-anchor M domain-containing protein [Kiritimatiellia bacterium]|nr:choice-of-anchor M domain-containing protein [Kiritimatiellia bacterium]HMO98352.1 choice-of-anchor M domain-containing protein [Kiritimatiellia bacterium]HMP96702.1 choice-of-anchor M domain-containing protein [Kiritimatiellia bacterium]
MSRLAPLLLVLFALPGITRAGFDLFRPYTDGHMDIGPRIVAGELVGYWKNDGARVDGAISAGNFPAFGLRGLAVFDANTPPLLRPAASQWAFLGVGPGEPVYILPSSGVPNTIPYIGLSTEDPSLSVLGAEMFRFSLTGMTGPTGAVFTVYLSSANVPINTTNGFPAGHIDIEPGDHLHFNVSFSRLGTYDLTFQFDALDGSDVLMTGSDTFRIHVTDGSGYSDYAAWRRAMFTPADIANDAVSGPGAHPFPDLPSNLQRYAFGDTATIIWTNLSAAPDHIIPGVIVHERTGAGDLALGIIASTNLIQLTHDPATLFLESDQAIFYEPGLHRRVYRLEDTPDSFRAIYQRAIFIP